MNEVKVGGPQAGLKQATRSFAGYDLTTNQVNLTWLYGGLAPLLLGLFVHRFVGGSLGINRALSRMKIPVLRL